MDKYFTNIIIFFVVLFVLSGLLFYTKTTKESFFGTSDLPDGTIVILDGRAPNENGFYIYTNQVTDTCIGTCPGQLVASNNICKFDIQNDGNLVVYDSYGNPQWASGTEGQGSAPFKAVMQPDGNFVLYDSSNQATWASNTNGQGANPSRITLQPDCNLVIYDKNNKATWASNVIINGTAKITSKPSSINWSQITGELFSVSLAPNGDIWGTDRNSTIYYKTKSVLDFTTIKGKLINIDTDGNYVCGTNDKNIAYCANYNNAIAGNWIKIGKDIKLITVSNNKVYAINLDNSISYANISNITNVKWEPIPITRIQFHSISLDNGILAGITNNNELYVADKNIFTRNPNFSKIKIIPEMENFINISLQNNSLLVTDILGNLWYTSNYNNPNWVKVNTKGKTFMATHIVN